MDYVDYQIEHSIQKLLRQKKGIEKKIALWNLIKTRVKNNPNLTVSTKKIEQLTFFGT